MPEQLESGAETIRKTTGFLAQLGEKLWNYLPTLLIALVVFLIGMLFARLLGKIVGKIASRTPRRPKIDKTASGFGISLTRILFYVILTVICLSILGVPTASIVTLVGTAGVTVGLALQNALSNLAGGFILLLAKPFQAGDYIIAGSNEGYVESVSTLYTELRTRDNRSIFLPNNAVSSGAVINLSRRSTLKICVPVSVSYGTDLQQARDVLLAAAGQCSIMLKDPAPTVTVQSLADSAVVLSLNFWVSRTDYFLGTPTALETAKQALDAAGLEIPFPQVTVHAADKS